MTQQLAHLQGLRTALYLKDSSHFHGVDMEAAVIDALDYLIEAKTEMENPDMNLAHFVRKFTRENAELVDQVETLLQMNQQLKAFIATFNIPKDIEHYKKIITRNDQGKTPEQWSDIVRTADINPADKATLLQFIEARFEGAMAAHGDLDDVLDD